MSVSVLVSRLLEISRRGGARFAEQTRVLANALAMHFQRSSRHVSCLPVYVFWRCSPVDRFRLTSSSMGAMSQLIETVTSRSSSWPRLTRRDEKAGTQCKNVWSTSFGFKPKSFQFAILDSELFRKKQILQLGGKIASCNAKAARGHSPRAAEHKSPSAGESLSLHFIAREAHDAARGPRGGEEPNAVLYPPSTIFLRVVVDPRPRCGYRTKNCCCCCCCCCCWSSGANKNARLAAQFASSQNNKFISIFIRATRHGPRTPMQCTAHCFIRAGTNQRAAFTRSFNALGLAKHGHPPNTR